ncbi:hypothetical protein Syun_018697 [Stephania yunnanensis]|uniref:Nucleotide-diphospho-sugar transferase domain-containing protein n=1 Tax=Stephania yunnanensis TaxID=152371 RepID=A0AAP0ITV2_9MAGN
MMEYSKNRIGYLILLVIIVAGAIHIASLISGFFKISSPLKYFQCNLLPNSGFDDAPKDELEDVLEKASMRNNKTLIIAIVNKAYVGGEKPMLDLFLESFWLGEDTRQLVDNLLLVAVDRIAYNRCKFLRLHCYNLETNGTDFSEEKFYMSREFIDMMWRRTVFLIDVLKRGYNFIFTDTDVMWLRDPFQHLSLNKTIDLQVSCDKFNKNQWSTANPINTGFYFIRSNNNTISLFQRWHDNKNNSNYTGMKEQDVLQQMIHSEKSLLFNQMGLKIRYLDTLYFSGFCQDSPNMGLVTTVHANCCRGISAKVGDLGSVLRDWKKYLGTVNGGSVNNMSDIRWSSHVNCHNSWGHHEPVPKV